MNKRKPRRIDCNYISPPVKFNLSSTYEMGFAVMQQKKMLCRILYLNISKKINMTVDRDFLD